MTPDDAVPGASSSASTPTKGGAPLSVHFSHDLPNVAAEQSNLKPASLATSSFVRGSNSFDRHAEKSKDLASWFGLPETEALVNDFHCALRKRVLLQGRLFVFEHYLCFNSTVFGYVKKKVISLADVKSVEKASYLKFPNSIEVEENSGHKEFFTSFLSRESAYRAILRAWRPDLAAELQQADAEGDSSGGGARKGGSGITVLDLLTGGNASFFTKDRKGGAKVDRMEPCNEDDDSRSGRDDEAMSDGAPLLPKQSGPPLCLEAGDDDGHESSETVWRVVSQEPVPPRQKDSKLLLSTCMPGTPKDLYEVLLAVDSTFMDDVLVELGNRKIDIADWKASEELGHIRDVQFVAPIKGAFSSWGVSTTRCFVTQRFCRYAGDHLVFEASQTQLDIPYGDNFTVDLRWDVEASPESTPEDPRLSVELHIRVPFSKGCFFKKIIENGVFTQTKENYTTLLNNLHGALEQRLQDKRIAAQPAQISTSRRGSLQLRSASVGRGLESDAAATALAMDAAAAAHAAAATPGKGAAARLLGAAQPAAVGAGWGQSLGATVVQVLLVCLLLLMCGVQLYILTELRAGAGQGAVGVGASQGVALTPEGLRQLEEELLLLQRMREASQGALHCMARAVAACAGGGEGG